MKTCSKCSAEKELTEFYNSKRHKDGRSNVCNKCSRLRDNSWKKKHGWAWRMKFLYGLSEEQYDNMFESQGRVCKICKKSQTRRLSVDHDHTTGKVRGLLCTNCNTGIGLLMDSPELLREAANYLDGAAL